MGGTLDGTQMTEVRPGDLVTSVTEGDLTEAEKHNLLITFQRPETGEMVITMLPPPPAAEQHQELQDHTTSGQLEVIYVQLLTFFIGYSIHHSLIYRHFSLLASVLILHPVFYLSFPMPVSS